MRRESYGVGFLAGGLCLAHRDDRRPAGTRDRLDTRALASVSWTLLRSADTNSNRASAQPRYNGKDDQEEDA